ncbi:MAG: carboxypeptidase-like regulatory domain-containing protein, partial [Bryobacteraceae bacterium]
MRNCVPYVVLLLFAAIPAAAQYAASLQVTIQDPSGGLIPKAAVKLQNNGTHITRNGTSNNQGFYR